MQPIISITESDQDLRFGASGAEERRPRYPQGRNLRPVGSQRRGQDDADQHRLRHRHADLGSGARRRPRHPARLSRGALENRPRAAGVDHRHVRDGVGDGELQPRAVRARAEPGAHRESAARPVAVGEAQGQDHDAVGRHEAARADRQGPVARAARSCFWTNRRQAWTWSCAATCGRSCGACAKAASRSS